VPLLEHIRDIFARNVKKYRLKLSLTQEVLAERSGLHRTYISAVETKKRSISLDNIQKIANALETDVHKLFLSDVSK